MLAILIGLLLGIFICLFIPPKELAVKLIVGTLKVCEIENSSNDSKKKKKKKKKMNKIEIQSQISQIELMMQNHDFYTQIDFQEHL